MYEIVDIKDINELYNFQSKLNIPYMFHVDFEEWKKSMFYDIDGDGRTLFKTLYTKGIYLKEKLVGYIQYGKTAFGFNRQGEISNEVSHSVIRSLYFEKHNIDIGSSLIEYALKELKATERIYAFFHYFGMSCYARHGKLFESLEYIKNLLIKYGFVIEHENIYYSSKIEKEENNKIQINWKGLTEGQQQYCDFILDNTCVGGCEVHFLKQKEIAYLRWIFINEEFKNKGIGSKCLKSLRYNLYKKGIRRFDTDTALNNIVAQHYYEKNNFKKEGITRSFFLDL